MVSVDAPGSAANPNTRFSSSDSGKFSSVAILALDLRCIHRSSKTIFQTADFSRSDFMRIADKLGSIKGRFIVSLNDRPEVREVFSSFRICEVPLTYTIVGGEGKPVSEVIIMDTKNPSVQNSPK